MASEVRHGPHHRFKAPLAKGRYETTRPGDSEYRAETRALGGRVEAYEGVAANVEHAQSKIAMLNEQIGADKAKLKEFRAKKGASGRQEGVV